MRLILFLAAHATFSASGTSIPPTTTERYSEQDAHIHQNGESLLNKWKGLLANLKESTNSLIGLWSRVGPSDETLNLEILRQEVLDLPIQCLALNSDHEGLRSNKCAGNSPKTDHLCEAGPSNSQFGANNHLNQEGPSNLQSRLSEESLHGRLEDAEPSTNCHADTVVIIPDTLNAEELGILRNLEQRNEDLRRLRREMELVWTKRSAKPMNSIQRLEIPIAENGQYQSTEPSSELARLEGEKAQINWEIQKLQRILVFYGRYLAEEFETNPYTRRGDELLQLPGIPMRLQLAQREGHYENLCNRLVELRTMVDEIEERIHEMETKIEE